MNTVETEIVNQEEAMNVRSLFKLSTRVSKICKLFAEENIVVRFEESAETASFNPQHRILTMPYNMAMLSDDDIMILFVTHEVGHAFWSDESCIDEMDAAQCFRHFNIVEDIRIERKIKLKYPGLVSSYHKAYLKLINQGFFGPMNRHRYMSFANRLNIVAKVGPVTSKHIKLSVKEAEFFQRCLSAETLREAMDLAIELKNWESSEQIFNNVMDFDAYEGLLDEIIKEYADDDDEDPDNTDDEDPDEADDSLGGGFLDPAQIWDGMTPEERDEAIAKLEELFEDEDVQEGFDERLKSDNVVGATFIQYKSLNSKLLYRTPEQFIADSRVDDIKYTIEQDRAFLQSLERSVSYMAKEFEMKKAAARYKNAKISRTGAIDINRICQYQVTDEVFATKKTFKDSKKHGMVILIDASGSIELMFDDMINQVILLTEYARKISVPFKVLMFGASMKTGDLGAKDPNDPFEMSPMLGQVYTNRDRRLIEVLSSDMKREDYLKSVTILRHKNGHFYLGNTPTLSAMTWVEQNAIEFFNKHNVTNRKLFVITDGEPTDDITRAYTRGASRQVIVDPMNHRVYKATRTVPYTGTSIMGKMFKDRYDIDMTTLLVARSASAMKYSLGSFVSSETKEYDDAVNSLTFRSKKYVKTVDSMGNPLFVVRPIASETSVDLDSITEDSTVGSATSAFAKAMKRMQISQTMLQALSEQFAV